MDITAYQGAENRSYQTSNVMLDPLEFTNRHTLFFNAYTNMLWLYHAIYVDSIIVAYLNYLPLILLSYFTLS